MTSLPVGAEEGWILRELDRRNDSPRARLVVSFAEMIGLARLNHRHALQLLALVAPLLLFATLAELRGSETLGWDVSVMRLVHAARTRALDTAALFLSSLGSSVGVVVLASALVLILLVRGRRGDALFLGSALAGVGPLVAALKDLFERPRPHLWPSIAPAHGFSFPSAHAAASLTLAAVVIVLARRTRRRWLAVAVCASFALGVGLSRVYLGVHYPSDVVAGWCAATAWTLTLCLLRTLVLRQRGNTRTELPEGLTG